MNQSESDFQRQTIQFAQMHRWKVAHFRTMRTFKGNYITPVQADGAGWLDLICVRLSRLIIVEIKSEKGKLSPAQKMWFDILQPLADAGKIELYLWRPSQWKEIEVILR